MSEQYQAPMQPFRHHELRLIRGIENGIEELFREPYNDETTTERVEIRQATIDGVTAMTPHQQVSPGRAMRSLPTVKIDSEEASWLADYINTRNMYRAVSDLATLKHFDAGTTSPEVQPNWHQLTFHEEGQVSARAVAAYVGDAKMTRVEVIDEGCLDSLEVISTIGQLAANLYKGKASEDIKDLRKRRYSGKDLLLPKDFDTTQGMVIVRPTIANLKFFQKALRRIQI